MEPGERDALNEMHVVRYPSGDKEFRMSEKAPEEGDVLKRNGDNWVVVEIKEDAGGKSTVVLQPGLKRDGS